MLYVSRLPKVADLDAFRAEGIRRIVAIKPHDGVVKAWATPGEHYESFDFEGSPPREAHRKAREIAKVVSDGQRVVVCCELGQTRSPAFAYLVLRKLGLKGPEIEREFKKHSLIAIQCPDVAARIKGYKVSKKAHA